MMANISAVGTDTQLSMRYREALFLHGQPLKSFFSFSRLGGSLVEDYATVVSDESATFSECSKYMLEALG